MLIYHTMHAISQSLYKITVTHSLVLAQLNTDII